jgi:hypothetical protein
LKNDTIARINRYSVEAIIVPCGLTEKVYVDIWEASK